MKSKLLLIIIAFTAFIYLFGGNKNSSDAPSNNYGQYDKGTAMCDKGAYGEVNGLCK